jgi:hypothetical protein
MLQRHSKISNDIAADGHAKMTLHDPVLALPGAAQRMEAIFAGTPPLPPPPVPMTPPQAPHLGRSIGGIAIYFALQIAIGFALALLAGFAIGLMLGLHGHAHFAGIGPQVQAVLAQPNVQAVLTTLTLAGVALWALWWAHRSWPRLWSLAAPPGFGFSMPAQPAFFVLAIVAGLAIPMLGGAMTRLFAGSHAVTQDIRQLGTQTALVFRIPLTVLLVSLGPLVEELLFRGVLLSALLRRWHVGWAVSISSLAFVTMHLPGLQMQWYALPGLLLLAVVLAWLRLQSRSIWPSVLTHAINNALAVMVWFVAVKPLA